MDPEDTNTHETQMFCLHYKTPFLKFFTPILFTPNLDLMDTKSS